MYEVILKNPAKRFLKKLDNSDKIRIIKKLEELSKNPYISLRLVGNLSGLWKLRTGKQRILYEIIDNELVVNVIDIDNRGKIYD